VGKTLQATAEQGQRSIFDGDPMTTENNDCATAELTLDGGAATTAATIDVADTATQPVVDQDSALSAAILESPQEIVAPQPKPVVAINEPLGLRLRAAREAKGLTREAAAQHLRLPARSCSRSRPSASIASAMRFICAAI